MMSYKGKIILVVAAHPDDEILGCGGTVAKLTQQGAAAYSIILGEGVTSRDEVRDRTKREEELSELKKQAIEANKIVGVKEVMFCDFPDNMFDSVALLDVIKEIERLKKRIRPDIVFTHSAGDLNIDHRVTYNAVLTACRPIQGETVKEIYAFEVNSSTEWNYPVDFHPNIFVDIDKTIELKAKSLACYKNEMREFPHPRSIEAVRNTARYRGSSAGLLHAEAFSLIRKVE